MAIKSTFNEQCITYSQMNMISNSRLFWRRFTTWIRVYIISRYQGIGTEEEAFRRLYFETSGIGNLLQIIFERENANTISLLLNQFTYAICDLITAQLHGNTAVMTQNVNRLYEIAGNFAGFLASINPYINESEWRNMLNLYIQYTFEEANSFLSGSYSQDIELYERLTELTDEMGDFLAQSLVDYINSGFSLTPQSNLQCITYDQMNQIYTIRMFWLELFNWTRAYMLSRYSDIGNSEEVKARLYQVPIDYINALQQFFGVNLDLYLEEIVSYINLIDQLITAQTEGNIYEIDRITGLLYQDADERAETITSLNPYWDVNEWKARLNTHIRYLIEQSSTFLTGNYSQNLDVFRTLLDLAENTSSYFAQGLFHYLIANPQSI